MLVDELSICFEVILIMGFHQSVLSSFCKFYFVVSVRYIDLSSTTRHGITQHSSVWNFLERPIQRLEKFVEFISTIGVLIFFIGLLIWLSIYRSF